MMSAMASCATGTRQLFTTSPLIKTAHAPHSPSPHPSLAPVSFSCSRRTSSNRVSGCASIVCFLPLTVQSTVIPAALDKLNFHGVHQHLLRDRVTIQPDA